MVLGNMDIGLNTANFAAIIILTLLTLLNTFGVKLGALIQNIFTSAKIFALLAVVFLGVLARNATAIAANFSAGAFWHGAGWHDLHPIQVGVGGPTAFVGMLTALAVVQGWITVFSRCLEQCDLYGGRGAKSSRNLPLSLALGTGIVLLLYILLQSDLLAVLPLHGDVAERR